MPYPAASRLIALAPLALAACASGSADYPSLAIRDVERVEGEFVPDASIAPIPQAPPPATDTLERLAQLSGQIETAHAAFMRSVPAARNAVSRARGSAVGSDNWASAQVALADLDSSRSQAAIALADIDAIFIDASVELTQRERLDEIRDTALALIRQEDEILAEFRDMVRP